MVLGQMFVSGISSQYDDKFPVALKKHIEQRFFDETMARLNDALSSFWPCLPAFLMGYGCCLCTGGLSLLIPWICISEAEDSAKTLLKEANEHYFFDKNLEIRLVKKCCVSWVSKKEMMKNGIGSQ